MKLKSGTVVAGNSPNTKPENRIIYPALDGIRALAFFMVFAQHYLLIPWGWSGVDLFFVLSGFLITGILYDTRKDTHRVRNFYVRRSLRIFPLYYSVMLLFLLAQPLANWSWNGAWLVWAAYLGNFARFVHPSEAGSALQSLADFQLHGWIGGVPILLYMGHFWSLCVEEQFYLMWPWVVFWLRDRRKLAVICGLSVPVALFFRLAGQHMLPQWALDNEILYRATPFRIDALLFGGFLALALRSPAKDTVLKLSRFLLPVMIAALALWMLLSPYGHIWRHGYQYPWWRFTWGLTAIDFLAGAMILASIQRQTVIHRIFNFRPLRSLGRISYGLYVLHDIPHAGYVAAASAMLQLRHSDASANPRLLTLETRSLAAVFALFTTIVLAALSYRFLETPFLNLKERWTVRH